MIILVRVSYNSGTAGSLPADRLEMIGCCLPGKLMPDIRSFSGMSVIFAGIAISSGFLRGEPVTRDVVSSMSQVVEIEYLPHI